MSRYCSRHLPERTTEEILAYRAGAIQGLENIDPRTKMGKSLLRRKIRCQEVLTKRGVQYE